MISWSKFKDATINAAGKRILKVLGFSLSTADECLPFGDDGCPLPNMLAIYCKTSNIGEPIVIGYINKKQLASPGEKRIYSMNPDGSLSAYIWMKANNVIELNGNSDNVVRYQSLATGLNNQDNLINTELGKIAAAITGLGGSYVPGNITTDINSAKINEVKCTSAT